MIKRILAIAFVCILLAGCVTNEPAGTGTLHLTSSPAGAEIYLDSQYRGTTPSIVSGVTPGNHSLEFRLKGYRSWKSAIVVPAGDSQFSGTLPVMPASSQEPADTGLEETAVPAHVTVTTSRDQMVIGDSMTFSGTAAGTGGVLLKIFGPGAYTYGVTLDTVKPDSVNAWSYTWNPGTKLMAGSYIIIAYDAAQTVSGRATFRAIGNGVVSVHPSSYAVIRGGTVIFSGQCTTGAPSVRVVLSGPDRYSGGLDLGSFPVNADNTWSLRYTTDISMPVGVYSVYVSDIPQTTTGSAQFTIGFAS